MHFSFLLSGFSKNSGRKSGFMKILFVISIKTSVTKYERFPLYFLMELKLIIAAFNHEFLDKELREEAAENFLRTPLQLKLITSASCQVLEENDDEGKKSFAYLGESTRKSLMMNS